MLQIADKTGVMSKTETRAGYKVFIDTNEKARFDAFLAEKGLIQQDTATKIFRWFIEQEDQVQMLVLGLVKPTPELHRLLLNKMMETPKKK